MPHSIAVLTGDLIASTRAGPDALDRTMTLIAEAADGIAGWFPHGPAQFYRYRGDGWQMAIPEGAFALRAALIILARLRADETALGTRISIGIGPADPTGTRDLPDAHGPAFVASGQGLDGMSRLRNLTVQGPDMLGLHGIIVELLEEHARKWTREQAAAAVLWLHPDNPTLNDIAPRLGITPQAVNYRLSGGSVQAIRRALARWEEAFETFENTGRWDA